MRDSDNPCKFCVTPERHKACHDKCKKVHSVERCDEKKKSDYTREERRD